MRPEDFVTRLEQLAEEGSVPYARLRLLAEAEAEFMREMAEYKGHSALSNASKCFFLETVEQFNRQIRPAVTTPLESDHALLFERLVHTFQSLRAAEIVALSGYPLQGYTILRNVSDNCILASAALQGLTKFERLEGVLPGGPVDPQKAKKIRKNEEYVVRRQMDGKDSGLSAATLDLLKILDEMYDAETHGARISLSHSAGWLKGKQPLPVTPAFSEFKASIFINRHVEVAWMAHRLLPLIQPPNLRFEKEWASKWETIDASFALAVMSITKQLGKPIGGAVCEFVRAKFPFNSSSQFPK